MSSHVLITIIEQKDTQEYSMYEYIQYVYYFRLNIILKIHTLKFNKSTNILSVRPSIRLSVRQSGTSVRREKDFSRVYIIHVRTQLSADRIIPSGI